MLLVLRYFSSKFSAAYQIFMGCCCFLPHHTYMPMKVNEKRKPARCNDKKRGNVKWEEGVEGRLCKASKAGHIHTINYYYKAIFFEERKHLNFFSSAGEAKEVEYGKKGG